MPGEPTDPIFRSEAELAAMSASERIRYGLVGAKCRYHANDNIARFIEPGEIEQLQAEVEALCREKGIIHYMILDDTEHLFNRDCTNLLITNRKTGLTESHLGFIRRWLSSAR